MGKKRRKVSFWAKPIKDKVIITTKSGKKIVFYAIECKYKYKKLLKDN